MGSLVYPSAMAELALDRDLRLTLMAQAHALHPVVLLGNAGLTDAVLAEIDRALQAHNLIKVRVPLDDRENREAVFVGVAERLGAARVQTIGKLVVLYRPPPPAEEEPAPPPRPRRETAAKGARRRATPGKRQT